MLAEQQFDVRNQYREAFRLDDRVEESGTRHGFYTVLSAKGDHLQLPLEHEAPDEVIAAVKIYLDATALI